MPTGQAAGITRRGKGRFNTLQGTREGRYRALVLAAPVATALSRHSRIGRTGIATGLIGCSEGLQPILPRAVVSLFGLK